MMKEMQPGGAADAFAVLPFRQPDTGPITIMTQRIEPFIAEALDCLSLKDMPEFAVEGPVAKVCAGTEREIADSGLGPAWLAKWLGQSAAFLARLYAELAGTDHIKLRFDVITDDACERFHIDNVRLRLLCTYRGPGTQWLDPRQAAKLAAGEPPPQAAIRDLERGAVALIRGSRDPDRPGLIHRSPPVANTGAVRLLLVVDDGR